MPISLPTIVCSQLRQSLGPPPQKTAQIVESLEVWDYRRHNKIASARLANYAVRGQRHNPVRFTSDGALLVAAEPTKAHVLDAATLEPIRLIEPASPPDFKISAIETSPVGHVAIIAADKGAIHGELFAYDLDSGNLLLEWKPPARVRSIAWKPDGTQFAVAASLPCRSLGGDVIVFRANPWAHLQTLAAKNAQSLAFSDDRLYSVQTSFCKGSVFNRHLCMDVFDVLRWRRRRAIFLPHKDIHDSVSFAKGKLLANTGAVETEYDWLDGTTNASSGDAQFTIWEGDAQVIIFTSPPLSSSPGPRLRLSRTGKMVLVNPQHPQVFQIP